MCDIKTSPDITSLPIDRCYGRIPARGYASLRPAIRYQDALIGGNDTIETKTLGRPKPEVGFRSGISESREHLLALRVSKILGQSLDGRDEYAPRRNETWEERFSFSVDKPQP